MASVRTQILQDHFDDLIRAHQAVDALNMNQVHDQHGQYKASHGLAVVLVVLSLAQPVLSSKLISNPAVHIALTLSNTTASMIEALEPIAL